MFTWNVEDMKLLNMARDENGVFACESETSFEDKVAFVDRFHNGYLSYTLNLAEKFQADLPTLKKNESGYLRGRVKTVSLQAWLKKNDTMGIASTWSDSCGVISIAGVRRNIHCIDYNMANWEQHGHISKSCGAFELVNSCFHNCLEICLVKEQKYYNDNNEEQKLIKSVCHTLSNYGYPECHCFHIGEKDHIVTRKTFHTDEYSIKVSLPKEDRILTIDEVKALETALAPVEEKYQQLKKAQAEMEEALTKAGIDFAAYLNERG